jgi:hypothetical protein
MGEPPLATRRNTEKALEDRLDSWKEIAAYLKRDVTTVQRWEKREGMPVHRHLHDRMGSVYASRAELDAWTRSRNLPQRRRMGTTPSPRLLRRRPAQAGPFLPDGLSSCRWQRRQPCWQLAQASGCSGRSTSGETPSRTRAFRRSRTSMDWSRPLRSHATVISSRFCRTGTDRWTSGLRRPVRVSSTTDPRECSGTRQSIDPNPGVLARWLSRHLLGSQAKRLERRRHWHLGGAYTGRRAEAIP